MEKSLLSFFCSPLLCRELAHADEIQTGQLIVVIFYSTYYTIHVALNTVIISRAIQDALSLSTEKSVKRYKWLIRKVEEWPV